MSNLSLDSSSTSKTLRIVFLASVLVWIGLVPALPTSPAGAQVVPGPTDRDPLGEIDTSPLDFGLRHELPSKALGETRIVDVRLPASYEQTATTHTYPVVLVLDGEFLFHTAAGVVGHLASVGRMPEAVVVGITNNTGDRLSLSPRYLGADGRPARFGGKEEAYLRFFEHELLPFLARHYRVAPFHVVIGLSPTASFVLHSFWKAPELFQAHIALVVGQTLSKRYTSETTVSDAIVTSVEAAPERLGYLYLASAGSNYDEGPAIVEQFESLERRLARVESGDGTKGLQFDAGRVEGSAYAVALPALLSAFELIFPSEQWDRSYSEFVEGEGKALDNLDAHFGALSSRYGFPVLPLGDRFFNRHCLRGLGTSLRGQERPEEAIAVFSRWNELYPREARAYFHLAYALKAADRPAEAYERASRGLEIARTHGDPLLGSYESHFKDFRPEAAP